MAAISTGDAGAWTRRCAYWHKRAAPKSDRFERRAGVRKPLILSGHGREAPDGSSEQPVGPERVHPSRRDPRQLELPFWDEDGE